MEVHSRSFVIHDLRFFGGGERACGVDERASGVGGVWDIRDEVKRLEAVGPEKMIKGGGGIGGTKCEERKVKVRNEGVLRLWPQNYLINMNLTHPNPQPYL
jgi:hypothetical protein